MKELDLLKAALLGIVQGLTEFLPVSSSGHLAIVQDWMDLDATSLSLLRFDVCAHVGTLVAVVLVFRRQIARFFVRLRLEIRSSYQGNRVACRIVGLAVAASIPTAVIGLTFKDQFEEAFGRQMWIGAALACTGAILAATKLLPRPTLGWRQFTWWQAGLVGLAQGLALMPGISRSGTTICIALMLGLRRRWAGEFSFLIAVPAILGATVFKMVDAGRAIAQEGTQMPWGAIAVGSVLSLVTGIFALICLLAIVRSARLHYFAIYCWIVSAGIFTGLLSAGSQ